jgi:sec-independent protein translocase protein TatA
MTGIEGGVVSMPLAWGVGPWEVGLIVLAILLLFGGKKLPELASGLGKGLREFRMAVRGMGAEVGDVKKDIADAAAEDDAEDGGGNSGSQQK